MLKEKLIIGLGVTGLSCADFYHKKNIPFKIFDTRSKSFHTKKNYDTRLEGNSIVYEKYDSDYLDNVEQVIISPGLDKSNVIFKEIKKRNISISTDIDIFKQYCNTPIISITGTNGKTTVVTMLEHVLKSMRLKSVACGNNGIPPLTIIDQKYDFIILELSSYQLEYMNNFTSHIGLITNIDYDHIERHKSMSDYFNIKLKIFGNVKHWTVMLCARHFAALEYQTHLLETFLSIIALVANVVPCKKILSSLGFMLASSKTKVNPSITPSSGASGVVKTFLVRRRPEYSNTMSVNVPPMSTANLGFIKFFVKN